jgi:hypothetical protein
MHGGLARILHVVGDGRALVRLIDGIRSLDLVRLVVGTIVRDVVSLGHLAASSPLPRRAAGRFAMCRRPEGRSSTAIITA